MKRILITGENSYIGDSFITYMSKWPEEYYVESIDVKSNKWKKIDFHSFDSIYHVAGIAHRKETKQNAHEYYKVNGDLAFEIAKKAKEEGVKQFIFLSSGTIFGMESGSISKETPLNPKSNYGKSKAYAEKLLVSLKSTNYKIVILRPLMVYGKGCKGNFQSVIKIVKCSPVFPRVHNKRSLIHIDNLCSFVKMSVDKELSGIYFPKNEEDVDIYEIVTELANSMGKHIYMSSILGLFIYLFRDFFSITRKAFSDLTYIDTDEFDFSYCVVSNEDSLVNLI